jgi:hypothetical protein
MLAVDVQPIKQRLVGGNLGQRGRPDPIPLQDPRKARKRRHGATWQWLPVEREPAGGGKALLSKA